MVLKVAGHVAMSLVFLFIFFCCQSSATHEPDKIDQSKKPAEISLTAEVRITHCERRKIDGKIFFIVSKYCSHCKLALPVIKKVIGEMKLEKYFRVLDVSKPTDAKELEKHFVRVVFTPTLLAGCNVYIGGKTEGDYRKICKKFKDSL